MDVLKVYNLESLNTTVWIRYNRDKGVLAIGALLKDRWFYTQQNNFEYLISRDRDKK